MNPKLIYLAVSMAMSGCGTMRTVDPAAPAPVTTVKVPVAIPCIAPGEVPLRPDLITDQELIKLVEGDFVTALHIDRLRRDAYEVKLEAAIAGCQ